MNSGPYAYKASTLLTELSPWPRRLILISKWFFFSNKSICNTGLFCRVESKGASFLWDKPPEVWKNETDIPTQTECFKYEKRNRQSLSKRSTLRIVLPEFSKLQRGRTEAQLSADYRARDDSLCHYPHEQTRVPSSVSRAERLSGFPHHLTVSYANESLMKFLFIPWVHLIQAFFSGQMSFHDGAGHCNQVTALHCRLFWSLWWAPV